MCFEIAVIQSIFAVEEAKLPPHRVAEKGRSFASSVGNILFGHWEQGTPKWRRLAKMLVVTGLAAAVSSFFGRAAFWACLAS